MSTVGYIAIICAATLATTLATTPVKDIASAVTVPTLDVESSDLQVKLSPQDISFAVITGGKHHRDRAMGVMETWCRGIIFECVFFSDTPDEHLHTVVYNSSRDYAGAQLRFLPALRHMKERTTSKWVVMVDDDTYIFMYNLMRALNEFSLSPTPIYMGLLEPVNTVSKPVRGKVTNSSFVNGGSGAVFNREALETMDLNQCIRQQEEGGVWEGWQSDWMVGACCKQYGIAITDNKHFVQWPENGTITDPISIHMVDDKDKMRAWDAKYSHSVHQAVPEVSLDERVMPV